jgi:ferredoxin-NADP reductase
MQVIFDHSEAETGNITSFYFKPDQPVRYTAGQFIELTLPHPRPDERGIKHWFTLSSAPSQPYLRITTRLAGEQGSSFKRNLAKLKPGKAVMMSDPMGDFVLPKLIQTPLVFVAGGIGITPYLSMLQWLADTGEQRPVKLLWGINSEADIAFQDLFDKVSQHVTVIVRNPASAWGGEQGQLSPELILGLEKPGEDALIYMSGPEPMIEGLSNDLHKAGVPRRQIVTDFFPGYETI